MVQSVLHGPIRRDELRSCEHVLLTQPYFSTVLSYYNISRPYEYPFSLCYPFTKEIKAYLDRPDVRSLLGVDTAIGPFASCSEKTNAAFDAADDDFHGSYDYVACLLDRGVSVLFYVGTYDWICNWIGNDVWPRKLEWSAQDAFVGADAREWTVDGTVAGQTRSAGRFMFATADAAGHMVPYDKTEEAVALVNRWLAGEAL